VNERNTKDWGRQPPQRFEKSFYYWKIIPPGGGLFIRKKDKVFLTFS
jgi:hypothetical protein